MMRTTFILIILLVFSDACVDRADFTSNTFETQLVIEGLITNEPGPYTVKLSQSRKPLDFSGTIAVSAIKVTISDDAGNSEVLTEIFPGTYQTQPTGIQGIVGRSYVLKVETRDGNVYESIPEKITMSGSVDQLYTRLVGDIQDNGTTKYRFKVFVDASAPSNETFYRWKYNAYYRVLTYPEQRTVTAGEGSIPAPRPCSGYVYTGGTLQQVGPCTCCTCWPKLVDTSPLLSASQVPTNGKYLGIEVGSVPVEYWMFYDKTMVEVKQLNISSAANKFWKIVEDQKDGGTSLFQPAIGQSFSNFVNKVGTSKAAGLFYAAGVSVKRIFVDKSNLPTDVLIPNNQLSVAESCVTAFTNSSNQPPTGWR